MTTGLVLILAILVLGGVIATVGDRLGMRVGKARLSLFRLRPRQTATLITIMTGILISAVTFGILFAIDDRLRTGVFELESIQDDLANARIELGEAQGERETIQRELDVALDEQQEAQRRLSSINRRLDEANVQRDRIEGQLRVTEDQLGSTQSQLQQIETSYRQAQAVLRNVSGQANSLREEIRQLQADRQQQILQREEEIAERDRRIAEREAQLRELEAQQQYLTQEVQVLEREFQGLRQGSVALLRNQTLSSGVVRVVTPAAAPQAVIQLLVEANRFAAQRVRPGMNAVEGQVIQVTNAQVEQLVEQLQNGREYVVRILSAGNYVVGEPCVLSGEDCIQVFVAAAPNELLLRTGEVVASATADPRRLTDEALVEQFNLLIGTAQFRLRQLGLLAEVVQIADGRTETVVNFFRQIRVYNQPVSIQAVAMEPIYTAGPAQLDLLAVSGDRVLFSTAETESLLQP
ncbi:DUF3084 domain-containing protein [Leptolyngbya sp. AN02str]|uniref:DUF3084 domain-containing protein n=1 Tax=Leptolyngbya sp. AN02str TaxID=3423363 RepID=UPI003D312471